MCYLLSNQNSNCLAWHTWFYPQNLRLPLVVCQLPDLNFKDFTESSKDSWTSEILTITSFQLLHFQVSHLCYWCCSYPAARSQTCTLKPGKEGNPFPFRTYLKNRTAYLGLCTEMLDLTLRLGLCCNLTERASSHILIWEVFIVALTSPSLKDNSKLLSLHLDQLHVPFVLWWKMNILRNRFRQRACTLSST